MFYLIFCAGIFCHFLILIPCIISRIQAINTSASDGLEDFKAYAVFQEINKKLQEVIMGFTQRENDVNLSMTVC